MEVGMKKRPHENEKVENKIIKKQKIFCVKNFRHKLGTDETAAVLTQFLQICRSEQSENYIFQYLNIGGNLLELLQLLENKTADYILILDAAKFVLLQMSISEQSNSCFETCRYFLNTHLTIINKMISSKATSRERVIILKLLTAMATLSPVLAKDILLYVKLDQAAIDVLINSAGLKTDNPRNSFVQFLTAFLLDGNYPLISLLLSKKNLLSSIINGLQYDQADTVCMVIHSLRTFILENPSVSKTTKMKTFSTPVVKDLVNLYNWKGPIAKLKKSKTEILSINPMEKSKVSDCVHGFLLVLCTSHHYGVIFRDDKVGLQDRPHQNALMYTVLQSLDRPWEHSYAGELVINIAKACPDLTRTIWSNMREFLDPRLTKKWLKTIKYATDLSKQMTPHTFGYCAKDLSIHQYSQLLQLLGSPIKILNIVTPKRFEFKSANVKVNVLLFLSTTLRSIIEYMNYSKMIHATCDYVRVKLFAMEHVKLHFPTVRDIIRNWDTIPEITEEEKSEIETQSTALDVLKQIVELFALYYEVSSESLKDFSVHCNLDEIFGIIPNNIEETNDSNYTLKASILKLFYGSDPQLFLPDKELFGTTLSLLLETQYNSTCGNEMLRELFRSTNIFDGCEYEINIWINSIYGINRFCNSISDFYTTALRLSIHNSEKYYKTLANYLPQSMKVSKGNYSEILEELQKDSSESNQRGNNFKYIRHNQLSSFILGCFDTLTDSAKISKNVKYCFNFALLNLLHAQTETDSLVRLIKDYKDSNFINESVFEYIQSWNSTISSDLLDHRLNDIDYYNSLTLGSTSDNAPSFLEKYQKSANNLYYLKWIPSFYISNLGNSKILTPDIVQKCVQLFDHLPVEMLAEAFKNPNLLSLFKPQSADDCSTQFIVRIAERYTAINSYNKDILAPFAEKVHQSILNNLKPNGKEPTLRILCNLLSIFKLNEYIYMPILKKITLLDVNKFINSSNNLSAIYDLTVYSLSKNEKYFESDVEGSLISKPLDVNVFNEISTALQVLNTNSESFNTSTLAQAIHEYLKQFPHYIMNLDGSLFESILIKSEYCNENAELAVFIMKINKSLQGTVVKNLNTMANKKGLMLRIIDTILNQGAAEQDIPDILFAKLEHSIAKAITKPQKAGMHFQRYFNSIGILIEKCSSENFAKPYYEKVLKYDYSEGFLVHLLTSTFTKHLMKDPERKETLINNSLLTLTNVVLTYLKKMDNVDKNVEDLNVMAQSLYNYLQLVKDLKLNFTQTSENESFRMFCKFALKIGISGQHLLLRVLKEFLCFIELADEDSELFFDMTISHSEFLNVAHKTDCPLKRDLFGLLFQINNKWSNTRKGDCIPLFLSSFTATNSESDITILRILKLYESIPAQTNFYDYKPFIIGDAASNFYSIRPGMRKSLWRQPNMADTLHFLDESTVVNTLKHFPNCTDFYSHTFADHLSEGIRKNTYNLQFVIPLFTSMLAPENNVPTYLFSRSGGLSLTIIALSSESKEMRHSACFVLSRYYHHLESRQKGKDSILWLGFVQSLCRGLAALDEIKLSNLVAYTLAQMSLILTQPNHIMYTPLANYLTAKNALDVVNIPELYTFVNSSSVDAKQHRLYILGVIQDGLKTKEDIKLAAKSMLFKLIMDMYHSAVDTVKIEVLKLILASVKIPLGAKILYESNSLIPWLYGVLDDSSCDCKILLIIVKILEYLTSFMSSLLLFNRIIDTKLLNNTSMDYYEVLIKCAIKFYEGDVLDFDKIRIKKLLLHKRCQYMIEYNFDSSIIEDDSKEFDKLSYILTSIYLKRK